MVERTPPVQPAGASSSPALRSGVAARGASFDDHLAERLSQGERLHFSGHALERMERRGIHLDSASLSRLRDGVSRAEAKGGRESLVLVDETAFVVAVRNRTVITAVDREHMREHVFTNIDCAVIA